MKYGLFYETKLISSTHIYNDLVSAIKAAIEIVKWKRTVQGYIFAKISIKPIK